MKKSQKIERAESKLPGGWRYEIDEDNRQITLIDDNTNDMLALANHPMTGQPSWHTDEADRLAINRMTAAVWGCCCCRKG